MDAGLRSLPGTAAEILDDNIRSVICPDKIDTEEWLEAHRIAHSIGLRSNITIMFGSVEQPIHWARHLLRTRELQKETGGFTEFVPLPFVHMASPIYIRQQSRRGPTFREALLMHSAARIAYRELVPNIQTSWVKLGMAGAAQASASRRERPRRHPHQRKHLASRRRRTRPEREPRRFQSHRRTPRPPAAPAHHFIPRSGNPAFKSASLKDSQPLGK